MSSTATEPTPDAAEQHRLELVAATLASGMIAARSPGSAYQALALYHEMLDVLRAEAA